MGTTWQMSFNPSKCTVIRVSTGRRHKFQSTYMLHGQTLDVVDGSKYHGVTVTDNLSWSKHVSDTAGKAHRSLGFLRRNFKHCSRQVKAVGVTIDAHFDYHDSITITETTITILSLSLHTIMILSGFLNNDA